MKDFTAQALQLTSATHGDFSALLRSLNNLTRMHLPRNSFHHSPQLLLLGFVLLFATFLIPGKAVMLSYLPVRSRALANVCMYVRAGAVPVVELKKNALKVGFEKAKIEEALGPPLFKQALSVVGISKRVFSFTKTIALQNKVRLGSKSVGVTIDHARFDTEALRFDLHLGSEKKERGRSKTRSKKRRGNS